MPYFSIVIPTYNRAKIIGKAIESVLAQKWGDWELIVVDDGSLDNTRSVVESFSDERIIYVYQDNAERGAARNHGSRIAKGKYVFFLDSDDLIYPDHLSHAHEQLLSFNEPAFFHSRYEEVNGSTKIQVPKLNPTSIRIDIQKQNMFACQFFLKREVALAIPFSEDRAIKFGEDWEVILRVAARYPIHISNRVTAAIVQHDDRSMLMTEYDDIIKSRDSILARLTADNKVAASTRSYVAAELTTLAALAAVLEGQKKIGFKLLLQGVNKRSSQLFKKRFFAIFKHLLFS